MPRSRLIPAGPFMTSPDHLEAFLLGRRNVNTVVPEPVYVTSNMKTPNIELKTPLVPKAFSIVINGDMQTTEPGIYYIKRGNVAILPIHGFITKEDSFWSWYGDETAVNVVRASLNEIMQDDSIDTILLHVSSGGGSVAGVDELVNQLTAVKQERNVVTYIEDVGASAAYWIAAVGEAVYANEVAMIGSLGVFTVLTDTSRMFEEMGIETILVSEPDDIKGADGTPGVPVSKEVVRNTQDYVKAIADIFFKSISENRDVSQKVLRQQVGGRVMVAKSAQRYGLIDGVKTLDEVLELIVTVDLEKKESVVSNELDIRDDELVRLLKLVAD